MITPKRGAKVLDFGLARMLETHQIDALSQSQRSLTGEGMIAGTLPYMAPELLRGERAIGAPTSGPSACCCMKW